MKLTRIAQIGAVGAIAALALAGCASNEDPGSGGAAPMHAAPTSPARSPAPARPRRRSPSRPGPQASRPPTPMSPSPTTRPAPAPAASRSRPAPSASPARTAHSRSKRSRRARSTAASRTPTSSSSRRTSRRSRSSSTSRASTSSTSTRRRSPDCSPARSPTGTTRRSPPSTRARRFRTCAVTPVHRADDSGTTENFTDYLYATAPDVWTSEPDGVWPLQSGEAAQGTSGVVSAVAGGNGTIGYADASRAAEEGLGTAAIQVGDEFVTYSPEAAAAIVDASPFEEGRSRGRPRHRARPHLRSGGRLPDRPRQLHDRVRGVRRPGVAPIVKGFLRVRREPRGPGGRSREPPAARRSRTRWPSRSTRRST